jgi:hypothetical protein
MDEMELNIALRATRCSWFFTVIALLIWTIYDVTKTGRITLPFFLLIMQNIIFFTSTQIFKWKMGDESGKKTLYYSILLTILFLIIFGIVMVFISK